MKRATVQKLFSTQKINKEQLRSAICQTAKSLGVNFVIYNNKAKHIAGSYNAANKNIFLDTKQTKKRLLVTFFHELGHHVSVAKGRWLKYHTGEKKYNGVTEFYIENQIDQLAQKLWNKYVDIKRWGRYKYGYPKSKKTSLSKWLQSHNNN